jgi:succinate dehydrogenase / fumarate reductase, membrane anchor subunit
VVWNGGDVLMMVLRESIIMKIHYGTALGALSLTVVHILMRLTQDFHESLAYENVIANYESVGYALLLELLLILISVHGFNGLRVILLEMKQGPTYEKAVTIGCLASMAGLIAYGSRTIIMTSMGMT